MTGLTSEAFRRTEGPLPLRIQKFTEEVASQPGPDEVLVQIHAVALNSRDVAMLRGTYQAPTKPGGIIASDCAAEVLAVGSAVHDFVVGDRVSPTFFTNLTTGDENEPPKALGGDQDGVLRRYALFPSAHLIHLPPHLSWEEAATIPCAGTTAWTALRMPQEPTGRPRAALLQGTGGVSLFALLLCLHKGIHPIITSASPHKLQTVRELAPPGAIRTIDSSAITELDVEVKKLSDGVGVDIVLDMGGPATVALSLGALRNRGGVVSLVGFLAPFSFDAVPNVILPLLSKAATLRTIAVGTKQDHQQLIDFISKKNISLEPLVHKVFSFAQTEEALEYLSAGSHWGKIVIRL